MSTKVKRYGWRTNLGNGETQTHEYATEKERDVDSNLMEEGWRKYTVTRTVRAKGRPLWWAIRQLQEGRAVVDAAGEQWGPGELPSLFYGKETINADWAQSWTLAGQP